MPNWVEGSLKLRGKFEDIKTFFLEGLNIYEKQIINNTARFDDEGNPCAAEFEEVAIPKELWMRCSEQNDIFEIDISGGRWAYVEGTNRAFISGEHDIYFVYNYPEKDKVIAYCSVHQAWGFRTDDWVDISKKYHLDVRLWGIDGSGQEEQCMEIINGEVTLNYIAEYKDWLWECPLPWLGG